MRDRSGFSTRVRAGAAALALAAGTLGAPAAAVEAASSTCTLVPALRAVTVNQGVGTYAPLARGKDTLVRFYLALPACAPNGSSIALTGGSLAVSTGGTTLGTVRAPTPDPSQLTTKPLIAPASAAPALNSPADPIFVVPASVLAPSSIAGRFTATFVGTIAWSAKSSSKATPVAGSTTFASLTGATAPISATVEQRTNALRILVVPMGDASLPFATEFPTDATTAVQNAIGTMSRTWPVPAGVADLGASSGGIRYTINPSLLDVRALMVADASGALRFCGRTSNFDTVKGLLAQYLQSWNTANPGRTADVVLGAVWSGASLGSDAGCAEGMASVSSPQAWIRAIPAIPGTQSMSGALASMEIAHTLGVVPTIRSGANDPYHSPNQTADGTAPGRGYNVSLRQYLSDDRTVMLLSGTWNNDTTTFEPADFAMLLCRLGGQSTQDCAASAAPVGTSTGVGAGPRLVIAGTTDLTPGGTHVTESYFSTDVAPGGTDAASALRLVELNGAVSSAEFGIALSALDSDHDAAGATRATTVRVFSASVPFDTGSTDVQLRVGGTTLYSRSRGTPVVSGASVTSIAGGLANLTNDPSADDFHATLSPDGRFVAWAAPCSKPPQTACGTADFAWRIYVAPVSDVSKAVEMPVVAPGDTSFYDDPAFGPADGTGAIRLAFVVGNGGDGDLYTTRMTITSPTFATPPTFTTPTHVTSGEPLVSHPTWSPDGAHLAFAAAGDIWIVNDAASAARARLTTTGDASAPSWSRTSGDGRIVYVRSNQSEVGLAMGALPPRSVPAAVPNAVDPVVTTTADSGPGSLRDAILAANASPGTDLITFAIPGSGVQTIQPLSQLPAITDSVVLDGTSQPGASCAAPLVELDGSLAGSSSHGVVLTAGASSIEGLVVAGFAADGIIVEGGPGGNTIRCNRVGTDADGSEALGNAFAGIHIHNSSRNTIGGTGPGDGNLVSGNHQNGIAIEDDTTGTSTHDNVVAGNLVGVTSDASAVLGNASNGIVIQSAQGTIVAGGNVVGGSGNAGVLIVNSTATGNHVEGNFIGTDPTRDADLGNRVGVEIDQSASGNAIGSAATDAANVIANSADDGVLVQQNAVGNTISRNSIYASGEQAIDLTADVLFTLDGDGLSPNDAGDGDTGANALQNFPVLTAATSDGHVDGTLNSTPGRTFTIELFSNPGCDSPTATGEAATYVGSVTTGATDGNGNVAFSATTTALTTGDVVTATATDTTTGDTSELSGCVQVTGAASGTADPALSTTAGGPMLVVSGEDLAQPLRVTNAGTATATGITITTDLAAGGSVADVSGFAGPCTPLAAGDVRCPVADLAPGASRDVSFTVRNSTVGPFTNRFSVAAAEDTGSANDDASYDGAVVSSCPSGGPCLWTIDPAAATPAASRARLVDDADQPSWGTAGRIAFHRAAGATEELWAIGSDGTAESRLTAGSIDLAPWLDGDALVFQRAVQTGPSSFAYDVFELTLGGSKQLVQASAQAPAGTDAANLRADVLLDCGTSGGPTYLVAVSIPPSAIAGTTARFSTAFDPSLSCAGGTISILVTAGIDRNAAGPGSTATVSSADKPPVAAVAAPAPGSSRLQWNVIPLRGSGKDAEEGELTGSQLTWRLVGPNGPISLATSTGGSIDVPVPPGGWTPGTYSATETATDATASGTASTTFTILADADDDGIPASLDRTSCATGATSADDDPTNAFGDLDGDGLPNQSDPEPCRPPDPATFAYEATTNFDPSTLYIPSSGNTVTVYVSVAGRDMRQIAASSVRLDRIAGAVPGTSDSGSCARFGTFVATAWTATADQGVAKFDRQRLIGYLTCRGVMNRQIDVRIVGASKTSIAPSWRFTGIGSTLVRPG